MCGIKTNTLIESAKVPVIKLQINLVKLLERELGNQKNISEEEKDKMINSTFVDAESQVLHIDITLDEPKKSVYDSGGLLEGQHDHLGAGDRLGPSEEQRTRKPREQRGEPEKQPSRQV